MHWVDQIERHAHQKSEQAALRFGELTLTWTAFNSQVRAVAAGLRRRGIGAGDRVAVLMTNRPEFFVAVIGANAAGAIAVPLNFRLTSREISFILRDSGATALIVDQDLAPLAGECSAALGAPGTVLVAGADPGAAGATAESLDTVLGEPPTELAPVDVGEEQPALILYTSGTTGQPKGAVLTHRNLVAQSITMIRAWHLHDGDEVGMCAAPMFHVAAIGLTAPFIMTGATCVIVPSGEFNPRTVIDTVQRTRVTHLFMVPAQWQRMVGLPNASEQASTLRVMSWGAAPASVALLRAMADAFPGVANISLFGQTEMSPVTTILDGENALRKIGSVGRPVPAVTVRIVDEDMNDVRSGDVGEIVYRGATLMSGYWGNPQATAEAFAGGWFHSGDLVRADEDGFIYVVDRKKDMIISGGENIYCAEVEDVLAGHPLVQDVAVIGIPHHTYDETPMAVIVPTDPATPPDLEELARWCRAHMASYKKPTAVSIVAELPRNASGKVLKNELRKTYSTDIS